MVSSYLTLLIGPGIPIPAPEPVTDALLNVQVNSGTDRSGFQLTFAAGKKSLLTNVLLPAGFFNPITTRVIVIVTVSGIPIVLMDGLVTHQEMQPSDDPGKSTLTITGEDLSVAMDLVEKVIPYPAMAVEEQVALCLAPYAAFGVVPMIIPPIIPDVETPTVGWETQHSTDLTHVRNCAARVGYVFYVNPGPIPGQSIAYFGPDINLPIPQRAVSINLDAHSNVDSLSFSFNGLAKKTTIFTILDPETRKIPIPIPVPDIAIFKPPLGLIPPVPFKVEYVNIAANRTPSQAAQDILGAMMRQPMSITASGSLAVERYGFVLLSRMLVGVRGAGVAFDGLYYVDSVTHNIKQGEFKQNFTLSRDGLISNTPVVVP